MAFHSRKCVLCVLLCFCLTLEAGAEYAPHRTGSPSPFDTLSDAEIQKVLENLDAADPAPRELAAIALKNLPGSSYAQVSAAVSGGDLTPSAVAAVRAAMPVLKARERVWRRRTQDRSDDLKSATDGYAAAAYHGPKWDDDVHQAIASFTKRPFDDPAHRAECIRHCRAAIDAGCDDPFVQYMASAAAWQRTTQPDHRAALARYQEAVKKMLPGPYAPEWKLRASIDYLDDTQNYFDMEVEKPAFDWFKEAVKSKTRSSGFLLELALRARVILSVSSTRDSTFQEMYDDYVAARPATDAGPLTFKGVYYKEFAWDARGDGLADTVTRQGWQLFYERLRVARESLESAWKLDDSNVVAAGEMIVVLMGTGERVDPGEKEQWVRRAAEADPDDWTACAALLRDLLPRWNGSHEQMINLGRQMLRDGNFRGRIAFLLVDADEAVARETDDPATYLQRPEVWRDVEKCYEPFLELYPSATWHRSNFARRAFECGQWVEADRLFHRIGEEGDLDVFKSKAVYDYMRKKAARLAAGAGKSGG